MSVIERAKKLIQTGIPDKAKELLLQEGFVQKLDPRIQEAYPALIPPHKELLERLKTWKAALGNKSAAVRYKGAKSISRDVFFDTYGGNIREWSADPRFTDLLIQAMRDKDPKVVDEAANAAGVLIDRYFADLRTFEPLVELLASPIKHTRLCAVFAISALHHPDKWKVLLPLLKDKVATVAHAVCRAIVFHPDHETMSSDLKQAYMQDLQKLVTSKDKSLQKMAAKAFDDLKRGPQPALKPSPGVLVRTRTSPNPAE